MSGQQDWLMTAARLFTESRGDWFVALVAAFAFGFIIGWAFT